MQEKSLVDQLEAINLPQEQTNQVEAEIKKELKITRQQLRREAIRMKKEKRSQMKEFAMKERWKGGAAAIRREEDYLVE